MSRRSKRRNRSLSADPIQDLSNEVVQPVRQNSPVVPPRLVRRLNQIEDRRTWAPSPGAREAGGRQARTVHKPASPKVRRGPGGKPLRSASSIFSPKFREADYFEAARTTIICLKRKARRATLFAIKKTGAGARSKKHRNAYSNVRC